MAGHSPEALRQCPVKLNHGAGVPVQLELELVEVVREVVNAGVAHKT